MARNRMLKKDFFGDPKVGNLPFECRLLFQSLWVYADDTGHGVAAPKLLKAQAFPYDEITADQISEWMNLLSMVDMIRCYEVKGQQYFEVVNFGKHQVVSRPSSFEHPKPTQGTFNDGSSSPQGALKDGSMSAPMLLNEDSSLKIKGKEKVKGKDEDGRATPHFENRKMPDLRFDALRKVYLDGFEKKSPNLKAPFEVSDGKALQAFLRRQPQATLEELTGWLKNAFASDDVPPLRHSFRLREFCAHAEKYARGPLKRSGAKTRSAAADETQGLRLEGLTL